MNIYFLLISLEQEAIDTLNKIHIQLRRKENFKSYYNPSEFFLSTDYNDIIEYRGFNNKKIVGGLWSIKENSIIQLNKYLNSLQADGVPQPDYMVLSSSIYYASDWKNIEHNFFLLEGLKFQGCWPSYYIENINRSIMTDMYKNIILGQIQKDFS